MLQCDSRLEASVSRLEASESEKRNTSVLTALCSGVTLTSVTRLAGWFLCGVFWESR